MAPPSGTYLCKIVAWVDWPCCYSVERTYNWYKPFDFPDPPPQGPPFTEVGSDTGTFPTVDNVGRQVHRRDVWYQIYKPGYVPWPDGGTVTELFDGVSNPCGLSFIEGSSSVNGFGQYPDTYFTDYRMCTNSCTYTATQSHFLGTAGGARIRRQTLDYQCGSIAIVPLP